MSVIKKSVLVAGMTLLLGATAAVAHSYKLGAIEIGHVWAKPSDGGEVEVYGPLMNMGSEADALVSAQSDVANIVKFCEKAEGKKEPSCESQIKLEPNKPVSLAPWGIYIQLKGMKERLKSGDSFPLTLTFEKAGAITIKVRVQKQAGE